MYEADAIQWAIDQIYQLKKHNNWNQEERNHLSELESLKLMYERKYNAKTFKKPTA